MCRRPSLGESLSLTRDRRWWWGREVIFRVENPWPQEVSGFIQSGIWNRLICLFCRVLEYRNPYCIPDLISWRNLIGRLLLNKTLFNLQQSKTAQERHKNTSLQMSDEFINSTLHLNHVFVRIWIVWANSLWRQDLFSGHDLFILVFVYQFYRCRWRLWVRNCIWMRSLVLWF